MALYFAYGSNMWSERLVGRVGKVRALGRATLADHRFVCNKRGADGTAKANIESAVGEDVPGVLFAMSEASLVELDAFEPGYRRDETSVAGPAGTVTAFTYFATHLCDDPRPSAAYRDVMVRGAREHELPEAWIAFLRSLPTA